MCLSHRIAYRFTRCPVHTVFRLFFFQFTFVHTTRFIILYLSSLQFSVWFGLFFVIGVFFCVNSFSRFTHRFPCSPSNKGLPVERTRQRGTPTFQKPSVGLIHRTRVSSRDGHLPRPGTTGNRRKSFVFSSLRKEFRVWKNPTRVRTPRFHFPTPLPHTLSLYSSEE